VETARTPSGVGWPEKLITQAEAFGLAASWPVYVHDIHSPNNSPGDNDISLFCRQCAQAVGQLRRQGTTYNGSLDEMLSSVLRHMVMAHDVPLAGLRAVNRCAGCGQEFDPAKPGEHVTHRPADAEELHKHGH
jgi:hypothetical protein